MASKRLSVTSARSLTASAPVEPTGSEEWVEKWRIERARDLIDSRVVSITSEASVEDACDLLLSEDIVCLAVQSSGSENSSEFLGLFDFSDVNAFLTLAATRHTLAPEYLHENIRIGQIVDAARAGRVPVHLVSNLSEKNKLESLPYNADLLSLLGYFSRGIHRVLIQSPTADSYIGMVSDRRLLSFFFSAPHASMPPSFAAYVSNPLSTLALPSLALHDAVIACKSTDTVLDAMKAMSAQGVSSVAVLESETGTLLSAVSVTDVGKIVVPSQSNQILSMQLSQFVSQIKLPDGSTDGVDKYPVYSVLPSSTLLYTAEKLLATNAHRVFVTNDPEVPGSPVLSSSGLTGVVSIVDILSLFAVISNIPDVDPRRMQRHRRASSASASSRSSPSLSLSRSSSRTSSRQAQSPVLRSSAPAENRLSAGNLEPLQRKDE